MRYFRWFLAFCVVMLAPGLSGASPHRGQTHGRSPGTPVELNETDSEFEMWYSIDGGGAFSSLDDFDLGASIGQAASGTPNSEAEDWLVAGFWAASGEDDTTEVQTVAALDVPVTAFSLLPIAPNPSHGVAYIGWTVPRTSRLRLSVYDVQGREMAVLADGHHMPGRYNTRWSVASRHGALSAGVYFVRLQTPDGAFIRRVVMIQ